MTDTKNLSQQSRSALGRNIQQLRMQKGLHLPELSRLSGVPMVLIDSCELGKNDITFDELRKIVRVFGVDWMDLM